MPAQFVPPQTRRGRKGWSPDEEALSEFINVMSAAPPEGEDRSWCIGDEETENRLDSYRYSGKYKQEIERMTGKRVTSRHFAVNEDGEIIPDAPEDGGRGIIWRYCLAWA